MRVNLKLLHRYRKVGPLTLDLAKRKFGQAVAFDRRKFFFFFSTESPCVGCGCTLLNMANVSSTWKWFSVRARLV
jgi:hypothetical protein